MHHSFLRSAIVIAILTAAASAADNGDLVWKTYSNAAYPGDGALTCSGLEKEIARVTADIAEMDHAKRQAEAAMQVAFDLQRYRGHTTGGYTNFGGSMGNENSFTAARNAIVKSRHVANDRVDYLNTLLPQCKEPSPQQP